MMEFTDPQNVIAIVSIVTAMVAVLALFGSFYSIKLSRIAIEEQQRHNRLSIGEQQRHNRLSVRPIASIKPFNLPDVLSIKIENAGMGSMIIKNVEVVDNNGAFVEWNPNQIFSESFRSEIRESSIRTTIEHGLKERAIFAGTSFDIIKCEINSNSPIEPQIKARNTIRVILMNLKRIRLSYTDIYGESQPTIERGLGLFELEP